ncbi:hypothetical protein [Cupriavidus sp. DL-D2]|uniref:hypothetical protein n=1 Tax=Cupriavidus sp. DL-D2 TaxID=3144974 RepID=UPI0032161014
MIDAKVIAHSKAKSHGGEIVSFQARLPKCLLAELNTHRVFSRNAGSSRAIPTLKILERVRNEPYMPLVWGSNQPGMQAGAELTGWRLAAAKIVWRAAARAAAFFAGLEAKIGLHKQHTNRLVETFMYVDVVITATDFDNFYDLRAHPDAQPEMQLLAWAMLHAAKCSKPRELGLNEWHLPYVTDEEREQYDIETLKKLSTARNARVSYTPFDGNASVEKEIERHDKLVASRPIHASPTEHVARPLRSKAVKGGNFNGWGQYRQEVEAKVAKPQAPTLPAGTPVPTPDLGEDGRAPLVGYADTQPDINIVVIPGLNAPLPPAEEPVTGRGGTFDGGGASANFDEPVAVASIATSATTQECRADDSYTSSYSSSDSSSSSSSDSSSSSSSSGD